MINIIPVPEKTAIKEGFFSLEHVSVFTNDNADRRVVRALTELCGEISEKTGAVCPLYSAESAGRAITVAHGDGDSEAYRLTVTPDSVEITSDGAAGAFYGIQSLRQLIKAGDIPCLEIEDEPDFPYRGFYHDITRGRVNRLEKLKKIADTLSYFKINSLQLYIEDAFLFREFDGILTEDEAMTAKETAEFEEYCHERFIELVPSLSTFGHLFTLLQSDRYNYISELGEHKMTMNYWMEKQWHHTVDVYHPDTIKVIGSMLEQYIPLFRSKYFNICCDETMDLCSGKNAGKDKGEAYFHHLTKLIDIVKSHGKRVMMWGDECMARPEAAKEKLPKDTIVLNWCYRKDVNEWIPKFYSDLGFSQIVCPGCSSWDNFIENVDVSTGNISSFAAHAKKYGALGMLNTNWGDFGHVCNFNCNLYGMTLGAEKSWNESAPTDEEYDRAVNSLVYGTPEFDTVSTVRALAKASETCNWSRFVMWHSDNCLNLKNTVLSYGEGLDADDAKRNIDACLTELTKLRSHGGSSEIPGDIALAAEALALMNREVLYANGVEGYGDGATLQADFDKWLERYSAAWLRGDKPSGLPRLAEFIKHITEIPIKA